MDIDIEAFVRSVVLRSASLEQRVSSYLKGEEFQETIASQARLIRWEKQFFPIGPAAFHDHIIALGLSPTDLPKVLGTQRPRQDASIPRWADLLGSILEGILDPDGCEAAASRVAMHLTVDIPAPFLELYWPVVRCASHRLKETVEGLGSQLSDNAQTALEAHLLNRLLEAGRQVVELQFAVFQTLSLFDFAPDGARREKGTVSSPKDFVGPIPGKRLLQFFDDYPVHARHCAVLACHWINAIQKFSIRLTQDRPQLEDRFNQGQCIGMVAGLQAGLSDPHCGGETVWSLTFSGGCMIVYKPRSLSAEQQFSELLWGIGDPESFRHFEAPQIWDRGGYGWMEFVGTAPCHNMAGVRRFYWRAGGLLGLLHLARGVDCHRENLIACGEYPVLIDVDALWHLQNLLQPSSRGGSASSDHNPIDTVLRTGFLPGGNISETHLYSASALQNHLGEHPVTSAAHRRGPAPTRFPHLPFLGQSHMAAARYTKEILAGFRWIGKTIVSDAAQRAWLLQCFDRINELPRRYLHRSTAVYAAKLREACHPALLKEGIDFSLALKIALTARAEAEVDAQETRSLEQLDIPYLLQPLADPPSASAQSLPLPAHYFGQLTAIETALRKS